MRIYVILVCVFSILLACKKPDRCPADVIFGRLEVSGFAGEQLIRQGNETLVFVDSLGATMSFLNSDLRKYETKLMSLDTLCISEDDLHSDQIEAIELQLYRLTYHCLERPDVSLIYNLSVHTVDSVLYEMLSAALLQIGDETVTHDLSIYYFIERFDLRSELEIELPDSLMDVFPESENEYIGDTIIQGHQYTNVFCGRQYSGCYNNLGLLSFREVNGHLWWLDRIE